MRKDVDNTVL